MEKKKKTENEIKKDFKSGITNLRYLAAKHKVELKEVINQIK